MANSKPEAMPPNGAAGSSPGRSRSASLPGLPRYIVRRADKLPDASAAFDDPAWARADVLTISGFHPRSSSHAPVTQARILHDGHTLALMFRVDDRYVVAPSTAYQSPTHKESCVEFFVRPLSDRGYFNFEFNAIGTLLLWYIDKPRRPDGSFESYVQVPAGIAATLEVRASLTDPICDEVPGPLVWTVSARIPLALFEAFTGPLGDLNGQTWWANFYKCADESSHPHWGYWADIGNRLDFHQPERFAEIAFE